MNDLHLEDEMRICINSDKSIDKFDADYYAKSWISAGNMRSDDREQQRSRVVASEGGVQIPADNSFTSSSQSVHYNIDIIDLSSSPSSEFGPSKPKNPRLDYDEDE